MNPICVILLRTQTGKNVAEFLIGWCDFPLNKDDAWKHMTNLTGSKHMICEFQKQHYGTGHTASMSTIAAVVKQTEVGRVICM
jgi:hypothetical protein